MLILKLGARFASSNHQLLEKLCREHLKARPIEILSGQVQIIKDPIDFYLTLHNSIAMASRRIALSSLYLGTGPLERFLVHRLSEKLQKQQLMQVRLLFDYYRSERNENGTSGIELVRGLQDGLKKNAIQNLRVGYLKSRKPRALDLVSGALAEVLGVHHMKLYIFDKDVLITGANLSHSYFTYRQDRYLMIRGSQELSSRLFDLVQALIDGSARLDNEGSLGKGLYDKMENYVKMWRFSNRPSETDPPQQGAPGKVEPNLKSEKESDEEVDKQSSAVAKRESEARQVFRQTLSKALDEDKVALVLSKLKQQSESKEVTPSGDKIYIYPVTQLNLLGDTSDRVVLTELLKHNVELGSTINISSGYMNFPKFLVDILRLSKSPTRVLTSAPEANSFFEGGRFKRYIPYFYRCYERHFLEATKDSAVEVKEYKRWGWTYHTKGIWISEPKGSSMVTMIGSSNFNMRSYERDTQCQLYIYSECEAFNDRLSQEWQLLDRECQKISVEQIDNDKDTRLSWFVNKMAQLFRRFM